MVVHHMFLKRRLFPHCLFHFMVLKILDDLESLPQDDGRVIYAVGTYNSIAEVLNVIETLPPLTLFMFSSML